jgi:hypothetical protein
MATNLSAEFDELAALGFPGLSAVRWHDAWKKRRDDNCVTRMRFAGLRYVVYARRRQAKGAFNIRRTMGYDEVRV